MRHRYAEITQKGAGVTAIGTGGRRYASAFIDDEDVPFRVLLDEDGAAAAVIGAKNLSASTLLKLGAYKAALESLASGKRQHRTGRRPMQLGGTLVIGPGNDLRYADLEDYAGDHADIDEVLAIL